MLSSCYATHYTFKLMCTQVDLCTSDIAEKNTFRFHNAQYSTRLIQMTFKIFSAVIWQISRLPIVLHPIYNIFYDFYFPSQLAFLVEFIAQAHRASQAFGTQSNVSRSHCKNIFHFTTLCIPEFAATLLHSSTWNNSSGNRIKKASTSRKTIQTIPSEQ